MSFVSGPDEYKYVTSLICYPALDQEAQCTNDMPHMIRIRLKNIDLLFSYWSSDTFMNCIFHDIYYGMYKTYTDHFLQFSWDQINIFKEKELWVKTLVIWSQFLSFWSRRDIHLESTGNLPLTDSKFVHIGQMTIKHVKEILIWLIDIHIHTLCENLGLINHINLKLFSTRNPI